MFNFISLIKCRYNDAFNLFISDHLTHLNKNYHVIVNQLNNNLVPTRHLRIKFLVNSRKIKTASEQLDLGLISICNSFNAVLMLVQHMNKDKEIGT